MSEIELLRGQTGCAIEKTVYRKCNLIGAYQSIRKTGIPCAPFTTIRRQS